MKRKIVKYLALAVFTFFASIPALPRQDVRIPDDVPEKLFIIAKKSIEHQLNTSKQKSFGHIECTHHDRGIFVRLINNKTERGCMGFVRGVSSFEDAVKTAAVNAAFFDSRYRHISRQELDDLVIEITIIGRLEEIVNCYNFTPGKHSIYVIAKYGKAFMQAQIATEKGWGKDDFLKAICRKARINELAYMKNETEIFRADTVFRRMRFSMVSTGK
jgi:uncharacterized protein